MSNHLSLNMDAFSDGQIKSKLWLCESLEGLLSDKPALETVWVYGSWYGLLPFLLITRGRLKVKSYHLFDIDQAALEASQKILDPWRFSPNLQIHHHLQDCQILEPAAGAPSLLINTSVEHFDSFKWWTSLPSGTMYALQATDMPHAEHINGCNSLESFKSKLDLAQKPSFEDILTFRYPNFTFNRYMLIGSK